MADAREVHSKNVKDNHAEAMKIFVDNRGWAGVGSVDIVGTAQSIDQHLAFYKDSTKKHRDRVKADPQYATDETGSPENMTRIRAKNKLIYNCYFPVTDETMTQLTATVASYCGADPPFIDLVSSYKPMHVVENEVEKPGHYYSTVICGFLYALKSKIMAATVHKVKAHPEWPGAAQFLMHSQLANQELSKILKKSKHHKAPKWRADSIGLNSLHAELGKIALREFQKLHPNGTIPNRLKRFVTGYKPEQNRRKARNNGPPGQAHQGGWVWHDPPQQRQAPPQQPQMSPAQWKAYMEWHALQPKATEPQPSYPPGTGRRGRQGQPPPRRA